MDEQQSITGDEGFSLIEVVVALAMLAVVSSAALAMFLGGLSDAAQLERRQSAVALTSAAVEGARSVSPAMLTRTSGPSATRTYSGLVRGRSTSDVNAQWTASSAPGKAETLPMSDPTAVSSTGAVLPLSTTTTVAGQKYTTSVLIGTCYRQRSSTTAPCDRNGMSSRTATPPAGYVEMVRVIATTSWTPLGRSTCTVSAPCSYTTAVLVDPSTDPVWSTSSGDAVDDASTVARGTTTVLNVLANDSVAPAATSPVTITEAPVGATATARSDGTVELVVPLTTAPGEVQFSYTVRNSVGGTTAPATVRVQVTA